MNGHQLFSNPTRLVAVALLLTVAVAACGSDSTSATTATSEAEVVPTTASASTETIDGTADEQDSSATAGASSTFTAEVWADNWFSLTVNGEFVGEDSVPITTERSFNAETLTFEATYPLTIAIEAKDFKETDSGIEYIGEGNQQMGDGGIIAQFTDNATGQVIAVTGSDWDTLVVHQAPLDKGCEKADDPDTECEWLIVDVPADWTTTTFDDSAWAGATVWSESDVSPKDGYDEIDWDGAAELIWGTDLEIDNTILLRTTING